MKLLKAGSKAEHGAVRRTVTAYASRWAMRSTSDKEVETLIEVKLSVKLFGMPNPCEGQFERVHLIEDSGLGLR